MGRGCWYERGGVGGRRCSCFMCRGAPGRGWGKRKVGSGIGGGALQVGEWVAGLGRRCVLRKGWVSMRRRWGPGRRGRETCRSCRWGDGHHGPRGGCGRTVCCCWWRRGARALVGVVHGGEDRVPIGGLDVVSNRGRGLACGVYVWSLGRATGCCGDLECYRMWKHLQGGALLCTDSFLRERNHPVSVLWSGSCP